MNTIMTIDEARAIVNAMDLAVYHRLEKIIQNETDIPPWANRTRQVRNHLLQSIATGRAKTLLEDVSPNVILDPADPVLFLTEGQDVRYAVDGMIYTVALQTDPSTLFLNEMPGVPFDRQLFETI